MLEDGQWKDTSDIQTIPPGYQQGGMELTAISATAHILRICEHGICEHELGP